MMSAIKINKDREWIEKDVGYKILKDRKFEEQTGGSCLERIILQVYTTSIIVK